MNGHEIFRQKTGIDSIELEDSQKADRILFLPISNHLLNEGAFPGSFESFHTSRVIEVRP